MDERRKYPRVKARVPVEIYVDGSDTPLRSATLDLSVGGCYIETMFAFPKGTRLELKLAVADTLVIEAEVATCDPQVGNGIVFRRMLPGDVEALRAFIEAQSSTETLE
jgi:hypothetical protein